MKRPKIERGVAIPVTAKLLERSAYGFADMEPGDSFQIPTMTFEKICQLRSAASWYGRRHNKKFSIRKYDGGYRCWRIK